MSGSSICRSVNGNVVPPKNVASLRHYYAYRDQDDQLIKLVEPTLTGAETCAATLIRKLQTHEQLTEREQLHFSFFVALLTVRTPQHRKLTRRSLERMGRCHYRFSSGICKKTRTSLRQCSSYQEKTERVLP